MKWNIVCDSSCDLLSNYFEKEGIGFDLAPLKIIVGQEEFVDDDNIDTEKLLEAMAACKEASSSACPSPDDFYKAFIKADNTICFAMTSALSGTYNCAMVAKELVLEKFPKKKIHVIDTRSTAGSIALAAIRAAELIREGVDFEKMTSTLNEYCSNLRLIFSLGSFDNLVKTGRMNPIVGTIASHLGIRAVAIATEKGEIKVVKKPRGENKALAEMVEIIKTKASEKIIITHCKNETAANALKDMLTVATGVKDITIMRCKGLTTFYTMRKGIIVSY